MIHLCVGNRIKIVAEKGVGEHKPRMFKEGQPIVLRNFHPHATTKWHQMLVKKQLGPLTYEVEVEVEAKFVLDMLITLNHGQ